MTGRARRGIDVEGHAVVLWHPDVEPAEVAGLASAARPAAQLVRPVGNMTINLVNQMGPAQAHQLLERSCAVSGRPERGGDGSRVTRGERMLDEIGRTRRP